MRSKAMISQKQLSRLAVAVVANLVPLLALPKSAHAVELVRDGKPIATIVIPAHPLAVESYAAKELRHHVKAATGAALPIEEETNQGQTGSHVYLGRCKASAAGHLDPT